jgi:glyoxylase-like metal-dependent hydrolase (beta-lactamase superfamily II)
MADRTAQHALSDFLQLEVLHSLGSYGVVAYYLEALDDRLDWSAQDPQRWEAVFPADLIDVTRQYNRALRDRLHRPAHLRQDYSTFQDAAESQDGEEPEVAKQSKPPRHPAPSALREDPARTRWVVDFYATAVSALRAAGPLSAKAQGTTPAEILGCRLRVIHDPARRGPGQTSQELSDGRLLRNEMRLRRARQCIGAGGSRFRGRANRWEDVLADDLSDRSGTALHTSVAAMFVEAHLRMHNVEHLLSHSFGDQVRFRAQIDPIVERDLERSVVLNTFVYVVSRIVPWIFAEDPEERAYVIDRYETCCDSVTPTYCMWISHQLGLLALQRRAYTWWMMGRADAAYRDFYKLKRFIRWLETRLDERVSRAHGAGIFLDGLAALADHHTGRIYRAQHAHTTAVRYFERAATRLQHLEELGRREQQDSLEQRPKAGDAVRNSRWRVDLHLNQGKAHYERGHVKRSLLCYARAWRAFLDLAVTESMATANTDLIDGLIRWLGGIQDDPDLDKLEVAARFEPLVRQFEMVVGPAHLRLLAADVLMRLGHLLFILKLPAGPADGANRPVKADHSLAYRCLLCATRLDPWSTLSAADLLKIQRSDRDGLAKPLDPALKQETLEPPNVNEQWPAGGAQFEEAARVIEYVLQTWLVDPEEEETGPEPSEEHRVARDLLAAFLAHTDSSNVKLAQVYRYLMQVASYRDGADEPAGAPAVPSLEFVCVRRYSSFFPFLPRPSAFRVVGGGYFLRVRDHGAEPFGIVIDPGPNFLENLYRCGFCLDDVNMVVVTHDHADHVASLDALLSLTGYRRPLGASNFTRERRLLILGNPSICARYQYFNESRKWAVRVRQIGEVPPLDDAFPWPPTLRIEPVETVDHGDAREHVAQGFLLRVGRGRARSSILFTSDTGLAPSIGGKPDAEVARNPDGSRQMPFERALEEASVVVAHVSSVPLPELRRLAQLDEPPARKRAQKATREFEELWKASYQQIEATTNPRRAREQRFLLSQLQFGFHSLPLKPGALDISPLSRLEEYREQTERHLYLSGLLAIARRMASSRPNTLLLIGELREELGTFRTRIAGALNEVFFTSSTAPRALTADIGLRLTVHRGKVRVLCTTCDLDNDLVGQERFHRPQRIQEVCVKGEDEGVFYHCPQHDPRLQPHQVWLEGVERYDPFGP